MDVFDVLWGMLDELGVAVTMGTLPLGWWGAYRHRDRLITIREGLELHERVFALAHELGHAVHNHGAGYGHVEQEDEAREFAARLLVNPGAYRQGLAEELSAREIARRQGLHVQAVKDYRRYVERLPRPDYVLRVEPPTGALATV